ncbi:MAG: hypothetical protein DMG59_13420 [Acidobacteria bacterium]|nr:MAG: hypothetical protein DMG59_13420 [Acidobacteriota bacterium]
MLSPLRPVFFHLFTLRLPLRGCPASSLSLWWHFGNNIQRILRRTSATPGGSFERLNGSIQPVAFRN